MPLLYNINSFLVYEAGIGIITIAKKISHLLWIYPVVKVFIYLLLVI